jgi:ATP-dependent Clp protease ATP-binding subunit ClpX
MSKQKQPAERHRNACCSFCRKSYRDVGPLVEGPGDVYICGECVELCQSIIAQEKRRRLGAAANSCPSLELIEEGLGQVVLGQERARKLVATAAHQHYGPPASAPADANRARGRHLLLIGPPGGGRVHLAYALAQVLKVPFALAATDLDGVLFRLLHAANYDPGAAQRGIVCIDDVDRIARTDHAAIRSEALVTLLKMLVGAVIDVPPAGALRPGQPYIPVDTTRILFLCGGSFPGLEQVMADRGGKVADGSEEGYQTAARDGLLALGVDPVFLEQFGTLAVLDPLN